MKRWSVIIILLLVILCTTFSLADETASDISNIDISHVSDGYVIVHRPKEDEKDRIKATVEKGALTAEYMLWNETEILPLQFLSGDYTVTIYQKKAIGEIKSEEWEDEYTTVYEDDYTKISQVVITANMNNELSCFLHPTYYVMYQSDSEYIQKAADLTKNTSDPFTKFQIITDYLGSHFQYDFVKSVSVSANILPDIEHCWKYRQGISQDFAALICAMLRNQEIPAMFACGTDPDGEVRYWVIAIIGNDTVSYDPYTRFCLNSTFCEKTGIYSTDWWSDSTIVMAY